MSFKSCCCRLMRIHRGQDNRPHYRQILAERGPTRRRAVTYSAVGPVAGTRLWTPCRSRARPAVGSTLGSVIRYDRIAVITRETAMSDAEISALRAKLAARPRSDDYRQRRK